MRGRQPKKSAEFLLHLLKNAENNAELKGLDVDSLVTEHVLANETPKMQPRTYSAHAQSNPQASSSCHPEMTRLEKSRLFLNQRGGYTEEKKISQKKLKTQKVMAQE